MQTKVGINKWIFYPIVGILIAAGTNNRILTYLAALLASLGIVLYNNCNSLCMLIFIMPFTHIFKIMPGTTSIFVLLLLIYVALYIIRVRRFHRVVGWVLVLTCAVSLVHFTSGMMEVTQLIKFGANLLFLYVAVQAVDYNNTRDMFLAFIFGVLLSSVLKYSGAFPNVSLYRGEHLDLDRFTGMHADPNYYGFNVVLSLCLIVIMYHRRDISIWATLILTTLLVWFAALTVSKMVFIMLTMPCLLFIYSNCVNRRFALQLIFLSIIIALIAMVLSGKINAFDAVLKRFENVEDAASLTTGRSIKWGHYIKHIFGSLKVALVGEGLNAPYSRASNGVPHNTYIDFLYNLGIVGSVAYIICVVSILRLGNKSLNRCVANGALSICMMLMWMSLSELLYFDFPVHLLLSHIVWNIPMNQYNK